MKEHQIDLFDVLYNDFKFDKNKPIRLVEMFSGIGTQKMGFERAEIDVDVIAIVEVDKYALLSYAAMHTNYLELRDEYFNNNEVSTSEMVKTLQDKNVGFDFKNSRHTITERNNTEVIRDYYLANLLTNNLGDISKVKGSDLPKGIDMLTYSFPCTDLSKAGQQKGLDGTRSGLVYEVFRIVNELKEINNKPKTLLMENVIDLIQKKFINEFHEMQFEVEEFGYQNYTFVMNAKDYGVAQNRNRVFMLSVPSEMNYVEPKPFKLEKRLKDYLELEVDESYYLSDRVINPMSNPNTKGFNRAERFDQSTKTVDEWEESTTITTREGQVATSTFIKEPNAKIELCNKMIANGHLKIVEATKKGYDIATLGDSVNLDQPNSKTRRGRVGKQEVNTITTSCNYGVVVTDIPICLNSKVNGKQPSLQDRIYSDEGTMTAITTGFHPNIELKNKLRIRKLTPRECWRLMGIDDDYFNKAQQVSSNAQLYKQAGNAIVVDVFANIVKNLI